MSPRKSLIRVIAPASLDEGYKFDVLVNDEPYTVTVPPGGVTEGEEFTVTYVEPEYDMEYSNHDHDLESCTESHTMPVQSSSQDDYYSGDSPTIQENVDAPKGRWRYPLCACCDVLTQATFWMGFCCTPVLLAQLLTRMGLNWKGKTAETSFEANMTFNRILLSFVAVLFFAQLLPVVNYLVILVYMLAVLVWIGGNLRNNMRQAYAISTCTSRSKCCASNQTCATLEDRVCMCFCGCCSLIQMARQTHNDKEYPGMCCTTTGLEPDAPSLSWNEKKAKQHR